MRLKLSVAGVASFVLVAVSYSLFAQRPGGLHGSFTPAEYEAYQEMLRRSHLDVEKQLCDLLLDNEAAGNVTKVTIDRFSEGVLPAHEGKRTLSASTEDPITLAVVQHACSEDLLLRHPPGPLGSALGVGGRHVVGRLTIHTTKRTATFDISHIGFVFGKEGHLRQRIFYSWALAKVIDEMVRDASCGETCLSQRLFSRLSGESVIESNKQLFWEVSTQMRTQGVGDGKQ